MVILAVLLLFPRLFGEEPAKTIEGVWQGTAVSGQTRQKVLLFVAPPRNGVYSGAMISPEGDSSVNLDPIHLNGNQVDFELKEWGLKFEGTLSPDGAGIKGQYMQPKSPVSFIFTRESQRVSKFAEQYEEKEYDVPVRDGVHLHTIVFSPKVRTEALPFLIDRSPYGWDGAAYNLNGSMSDLAQDGYFFVFQDIRGRYKSEGQFVMLRPVRDRKDSKSIDEATDTYDTIDWLLKNIPGNNGRAGILGQSYSGWLTEMALVEPHPALKAASEQASPADMFLGDDFHHNGAFRLSYGFEYASMMETGKNNKTFEFDQFDTYEWYLNLGPLREANARYLDGQRPTWNNFIAHPNYDDFWRALAVQNYIGRGTVPNLNVGGWFDQEDFAGPWRIFAASETPESRQYNYLVVGPWNHGGWEWGGGHRLKSVEFGSDTGAYFRSNIQAHWFAYWLKGKGSLNLPRIQLFETGLNQWKSYDQWPPKGMRERKLYLHASGEASFDAPSGSDPASDSFVSDPAHPIPYRQRPISQTYGGAAGWATWLIEDQRFVADRPDVAMWQTQPLESDVTIAGDVVADLFASTSGSDSDWVVKLIDVNPPNLTDDPPMGGYQLMIAADVLRGRFRNSFERPEPVKPNEVVEYRIDLLSHDHLFRKGHRIMIQVQSTWFPLIDRNPQKFVPNIFEASASDFQVATQRIFRDTKHPSAMILPVMGSGN